MAPHEGDLTPNLLFERVVKNAVDFLEHALDEIERSPKYSVIHFCAAVELFLKARLMAEHWSLCVSKRQEPDWEKFKAGNFESVNLSDAAERLAKVVRSGLTRDELRYFLRVAQHRNRMIHFFHEASDKAGSDALRQQIAAEQLNAWYLLYKLLTARWEDIFEQYADLFEKLNTKMQKQKKYLDVVYRNIKPDIDREKHSGVSFCECPACGFVALRRSDDVGSLEDESCRVCGYSVSMLVVECPNCDSLVVFLNEGFSSCGKCERQFEPDDLVEILTEDLNLDKDDLLMGGWAHCTACDGYHTVVPFDYSYICCCCFTLYDDEDINQCGWCSDMNAGELEESYSSGCVACEGRTGRDRDTDD